MVCLLADFKNSGKRMCLASKPGNNVTKLRVTGVFLFTDTVVLHFNLNIVKNHSSWLFLAFLKIQFANSICVLIFFGKLSHSLYIVQEATECSESKSKMLCSCT